MAASQGLGATKQELRTEVRRRRDALAVSDRADWSLRIAQHGFAALRERAAGAMVAMYWPMRSEADPRPLARELSKVGAQLCLPAFVGEAMLFRRWMTDDDLVSAAFSTKEPRPDALVVVPTLVMAPLLAFDARGQRLGWGKGYYDRALGELDVAASRDGGSRPFVVGIAFACQEVPNVPAEGHDRQLDAVITEDGIRGC